MKKERLYSLDLLRGIDIFFLTVCFLPILYFHRHWPAPEWVKYQFWHPSWEGFSVLDMVMPLFIFMAGAALPLALKKRLEPDGTAGWAYWGHVLKRVGFLWFLGLLALGFALLTFDPSVKHIMTASFTVLSSGVSFLLFALCYFIADVRGIRKGYSFILLFGRHSLFAYMMSGFFGFALVALFRKAFSNCGWDPFDGDGIVWSDARGLERFFSAETVTLLTIIGKSALICVAVWFLEEWNKRGRMAK